MKYIIHSNTVEKHGALQDLKYVHLFIFEPYYLIFNLKKGSKVLEIYFKNIFGANEVL